jgi:hypothetical protein
MEKPIAKSRRETLEKVYDPAPMIERLRELLENTMRVIGKPACAPDLIIRVCAVF